MLSMISIYSPCVCLCLVYLVHTLPVFVKYVWYIILLNVILYGTCIVCTVCLVCIGPGSWGGWWVQLIFCVGSIPGFVQWNFAWRFPYWDGSAWKFLHWDGICLGITVLWSILQRFWDISCEKFLQTFMWWESLQTWVQTGSFLHWDGICLGIPVLRSISQRYQDISCDIFLQTFMRWEIFANISANIVWWCCVKYFDR